MWYTSVLLQVAQAKKRDAQALPASLLSLQAAALNRGLYSTVVVCLAYAYEQRTSLASACHTSLLFDFQLRYAYHCKCPTYRATIYELLLRERHCLFL